MILQAAVLALAIPLVADCTSRPPQGSPVIQRAREIATGTERLLLERDTTRRAALRDSLDRLTRDFRSMPRAREVLDSVLRTGASYVTMSAAAYGLYLVDSALIATAIDGLMKQMNRTMFTNQPLARHLIVAIGPPAAAVLARHVDNSMVVRILGTMGPAAREAVPALVRIVGTGNVEVAVALARIGTPEALAAGRPVLLRALSNPRGPHTEEAITGIAALGRQARDAAPLLLQISSTGTPDARVAAGVALAAVGDTAAATRALTALVGDSTLHNRFAVIRQLTALGPPARDAVPSLIALLTNDADRKLGDRALAAVALRRIDPDNPNVRAALDRAAANTQLRPLLQRHGVVPP